ncbi:hypothetical protein B0H12DRAFT_1155503 [Mycena haematopus]|nr:hypothetical protein B0H12DRAFT_1155503 [Mycena haematopus]
MSQDFKREKNLLREELAEVVGNQAALQYEHFLMIKFIRSQRFRGTWDSRVAGIVSIISSCYAFIGACLFLELNPYI